MVVVGWITTTRPTLVAIRPASPCQMGTHMRSTSPHTSFNQVRLALQSRHSDGNILLLTPCCVIHANNTAWRGLIRDGLPARHASHWNHAPPGWDDLANVRGSWQQWRRLRHAVKRGASFALWQHRRNSWKQCQVHKPRSRFPSSLVPSLLSSLQSALWCPASLLACLSCLLDSLFSTT